MATEKRMLVSKKLDYVQPKANGFPEHGWLVDAITKGAMGGATSDRKEYFEAMLKWGTKSLLKREVGSVLEAESITGVDDSNREFLLDSMAQAIVEASKEPELIDDRDGKARKNYLHGIRNCGNIAEIDAELGKCPPLEGLGERVLYYLVSEDADTQLREYSENLDNLGRITALEYLNDDLEVLIATSGYLSQTALQRLSSFRQMVGEEIVNAYGPKIVLVPKYFTRIVENSGITDSTLAKKMGVIHEALLTVDLEDPIDRESFETSLRQTSEKIRTLKKPPVEQIKAARRIINQMIGVVAGGDVAEEAVFGGSSIQERLQREQLEWYQQEMQIKGAIEVVSEVEWLEGLRTKSYDKATIPAKWMFAPPEWIKKANSGLTGEQMMKEWRDVYGTIEGMSMGVARRRNDADFGIKVDYIKNTIIASTPVREKVLKWLYEKGSSYGFRNALESIVTELFYKNSDGIFEFRHRVDIGPDGGKKVVYSPEVKQFIEDSSVYKKQLAERLYREGRGSFSTMEQAVMMVSCASDFLELGGQYEAGDKYRKVGYASDALRTVLRPVEKFRPKVGSGEIWGGPWGEYCNAVSNQDPTKAVALAESLGIVPEVLSGSILNIFVKTSSGERMLGDALLNKIDVKFEPKETDFLFTWKKDHVISACDIWMYISGKNPLEFKQFSEVDNVITRWRGDLYNSVNTLRKISREGGVPKVGTRVVASAIGGSIGLWPFEGPYLRMNTVSPTMIEQYTKAGNEILRLIGLTKNELDELSDFFGLTLRKAYILNQRANLYAFSNTGLGRFFKTGKI